MTCPACGNALASGHERCAFCGALVAPSAEGALAPDHASVTPPGRGRADALREMGGLRKRERSWKDEVNDRVRNRRQRSKPGEPAELPLFADPPPPRDAWVGPALEPRSTGSESGSQPEPADRTPRPFARDTQPLEIGSRPIEAAPENVRENIEEAELTTPALNATDLGDLPLNPVPAEPLPEPLARAARVIDRLDPGKLDREMALAARSAVPDLDEEPLVSSDEDGWPLELSARPRTAPPVERPAFARERAMAAGLDFGLMLGAALVVVYFAGRAARVPLHGLLPTWPWLLGYLAFLGLVYAGYFTGATGQTLGKMATGLRVVDRAGQPPGFLRAFARGILGTLGVALAGLGLLPMLFDPARRALHDRVFRMRVVRR
jgi:uncharacterized RDD family membrane protein YckC